MEKREREGRVEGSLRGENEGVQLKGVGCSGLTRQRCFVGGLQVIIKIMEKEQVDECVEKACANTVERERNEYRREKGNQ